MTTHSDTRRTDQDKGQFIFSTHNVLHLNLKTYMKEQIYFVTKSKDSLTSELYSLADFPEVRYETAKVYEFYMKGILGGTAFEQKREGKLVSNKYEIKKKTFDIIIKQTDYDQDALDKKNTNIEEFFDVIDW